MKLYRILKNAKFKITDIQIIKWVVQYWKQKFIKTCKNAFCIALLCTYVFYTSER